MKKTKLAKTILAAAILSFSLTPIITASETYAKVDICASDDVPEEVRIANGCDKSQKDSFDSRLTGILNGIIGAAGLVAVIFIIIGGINYMTSSGDSAKVKKGKDTILYATIGLIICALAFAVVNWVIAGLLTPTPAP